MWKARGDAARQQELIRNEGAVLLASRWSGSFYKPFTVPGYTLYYSQYKDVLPGGPAGAHPQHDDARRVELPDARGSSHGPGVPAHGIQQRKLQLDGAHGRACSGRTNWGTAEKQRYFDGYLDNLVRALYAAGRVEWNSSVSWGYTFQAALVLYESAHDAKVKEQARAILDWMTVEAALHYFDGFQAGPDVRAREGGVPQVRGSVWPYAYLYFTDAEHPAPYSDAEAAARFGVQEAGYVPYVSYRPPRAAIEIAQRKFRMPVEIQSAKPYYGLDENNYGDWNGERGVRRRFEFETLYLDQGFHAGERGDDAAGWRREDRRADAVLRTEPVAAGGEGRADLRQRGRQRHDGGALPVRGDGTVCERDAARGKGYGPAVGGGSSRDEGGTWRERRSWCDWAMVWWRA